MHILLTTYGLLLIFVLIAAAQWRSATDMVFLDKAATESFSNARNKILRFIDNQSFKLYEKHKNINPQQQKSSKAVSSKVNSEEPAPTTALIDEENDDEEDAPIEEQEEFQEETPKKQRVQKLTSYLRIGDLFTGESPNLVDGKGKAAFILLKNLISALGEGQDFFNEAKEELPELEEQFVMALFEAAKLAQQENQWMKKPKHLAKLELEDKYLVDFRCDIFNGTKSKYDEDSTELAGYYSLDEFISMSKGDTIMSLWLAPKPLLMALFQNPVTVDELLALRKEMYREVKKNSSLASAKETDLRLRYALEIDDDLIKYIDFKVTTSKPPDMPKAQKQKR